jgi:uncharacterized coiled-coil DUF342 family protein
MTSTKYLLARFAQAFGIHRRNQRMGDAASETHLLREAEAHLGAAIWEKVEAIEEVSVEYWNLRKLNKERAAVMARLNAEEDKLRIAHEERAALLQISPDDLQPLFDRRSAIIQNLETLTRNRDEVVAEARQVRRIYDGLKMKLEVLAKEARDSAGPAPEAEAAQVRARLLELKAQFTALKETRTTIAAKIDAGEIAIEEIEDNLGEDKKVRRVQASAAFQHISEANKEISALRAEIGVLDTQIRQLHAGIGRHVSRFAHTNPQCAGAARSHLGMVEVMRALRRSISLNHRLANMAS